MELPGAGTGRSGPTGAQQHPLWASSEAGGPPQWLWLPEPTWLRVVEGDQRGQVEGLVQL